MTEFCFRRSQIFLWSTILLPALYETGCFISAFSEALGETLDDVGQDRDLTISVSIYLFIYLFTAYTTTIRVSQSGADPFQAIRVISNALNFFLISLLFYSKKGDSRFL
jgi:hypothetical protein